MWYGTGTDMYSRRKVSGFSSLEVLIPNCNCYGGTDTVFGAFSHTISKAYLCCNGRRLCPEYPPTSSDPSGAVIELTSFFSFLSVLWTFLSEIRVKA